MIKRYSSFFFMVSAVLLLECKIESIPPVYFSNGKYILHFENLKVEIDPNIGGRITSYTLAEVDVLLPKSAHKENYGSTLWPSPQNWPWPPSSVLDRMAYASRINGDTLNLTSYPDPLTGLKFSKYFWIDVKKKALIINYSITNISNKAISVAPWEVTRVPFGGICFYPSDTVPNVNASSLEPVSTKNGIAWFKHDRSDDETPQKFYGGARLGWIAHVDNGLIFIKTFPNIDTNNIAPGHGEVEIFTNELHTYIELENHGTYADLKPGESLQYPVSWYLQRVDPTIPTELFSDALVNSVNEIVAQ